MACATAVRARVAAAPAPSSRRAARPRDALRPPRAISGARHDVPHFEPRWAVGLRRSDPSFAAWLAQLTNAVESGTWSAVPILLKFPAAEPEMVLHIAAGHGQGQLVEKILARRDDASGMRAVRMDCAAARGAAVAAAARGHAEVLASLLDAGLDPNAVDEHDTSALLAASGASDVVASPSSCVECVSMLLRAGADPDANASRKGWKPIFAASKTGSREIVQLLIDHGADYAVRYHNGKTPLYCAAEWGRTEAVKALIENGADPAAAADRLSTSWEGCATRGENCGASGRGVLPAEVAAMNGHLDVAAVLSEATARAEGGGRFASCELKGAATDARR